MEFFNQLVGWFNDYSGIVTVIVSGVIYFKVKALGIDPGNDDVTITLQIDDENLAYTMPLHMKRKELTRPELLGRVGMLANKGVRLNLAYFQEPEEFFLQLRDLTDSKTSVFSVNCSRKELEQFNLNSFKKVKRSS